MLAGMTRTARLGALCWPVAGLVLLTTHLVVQYAWQRPYSWARHTISDLGNVTCGSWGDTHARYVCSPLHPWMNAAFVAFGLLLAAGVLLLWRRWRGTRVAPVLVLLSAAGWVLAGVFPADVDENMHVLGALLILFFGNLGLLVTARAGWTGTPRWTPLVAGALGVTAMVLHLSGHFVGLGPGGTERVSAYAVPVWLTYAAVAALRSARPAGSDRRPAVAPAVRS